MIRKVYDIIFSYSSTFLCLNATINSHTYAEYSDDEGVYESCSGIKGILPLLLLLLLLLLIIIIIIIYISATTST